MRIAEFPTHDWLRIRAAVSEAVDRLDEQDRTRRVRWCRVTGEHGVSVKPAGGLLVFRWGGAELLRMPRAAFVRYGASPAELRERRGTIMPSGREPAGSSTGTHRALLRDSPQVGSTRQGTCCRS